MEQTQKISFWKRPEGTTGKWMMYGVGAALLSLVWKFQTQLVDFADNMMHLGIVAGVFVAAYLILTAERPRTLIFYVFQMVCRSLTALFVNIDPIAILEAFAAEMRKRAAEVDSSIGRILGVKRALDDEINRSKKDLTKALQLAEIATDEDALNVQAEKAGRRNANIQEYQEMQGVISEILNALQRVKKRVDYHIQNSEDEKNELVRKNQIAKEVGKATGAARHVLGASDLLDVRNMAADRIREKYSGALGELDGLIQMSQNLDSEIDLNQLAFRQDGKARLADLRKKLNQVEGKPQGAIGAPAQVPMLGAGTPQIIQTPQQGNAANSSVWAKRLNNRSE